MNFEQFLPLIINVAFLGLGYWMGQRGLSKVWTDLTGDFQDLKGRIDNLQVHLNTVAPIPKVQSAPQAPAPAPTAA